MVLYTYLLATCLLISKFGRISTDDFQLDHSALLNSTYAERLYNVLLFRIAKFNRTNYNFSMDVENVNVDHNFEEDVELNNLLNTNQYNLTPAQVPRTLYEKIRKFRRSRSGKKNRN